jgi:hypothetical protein
MPTIAVDSSTLISLSQSCLIQVLDFLSEQIDGHFIVPPAVRHEIVVHPLHVKRYAFSALRMNRLIQKGSVQVRDPPGLLSKSREIEHLANNLIFVHGKPLQLLQEGEIQCLALVCLGQAQGIAVDEKTTRLLVESPSTLLERVATEFDSGVGFNEKNLRAWYALLPKTTVMRSTELLAIAARRGYFAEYRPFEVEALQATLAAVRNAGCSLTENELEEYSTIEDLNTTSEN